MHAWKETEEGSESEAGCGHCGCGEVRKASMRGEFMSACGVEGEHQDL